MKQNILFIAVACAIPFFSIGQTASDALRFSRLERNGSARNLGVMGSIGALGADWGALSTNPAGIASFRGSELSLTPGFYMIGTDGRLLGDNNPIFNERPGRFNIQQFGFVIASTNNSGNWKAVNFGIGLTQLANFRQDIYFEGLADGSVVDRFLELADGIHPDDLDAFEAGPAYETGAIYSPDSNNFYSTDFLLVPTGYSKGVRKAQDISRKGYINELQISFGGNYDNMLYLGAGIGVPLLSFKERKFYTETDEMDTIPFFNHLAWSENLSTSGFGVNLKLGILFRPVQAFRLGVAIHTPTAYGLTDDYSKSLTYSFTVQNQEVKTTSESPKGVFDYRLSTPWRFIANSGIVIGRMGFITGEMEYVDYGAARFNFTPEVTNASLTAQARRVNNNIRDSYRGALNLRFGGEIAYKIFRFRAGIGFSGTEYANDNVWSRSWSAGAGIRENNFFMDLAYRRAIRNEGYIPYATSEAPELFVNTSTQQDLLALTLGIKF